jgi:hypothetical protein
VIFVFVMNLIIEERSEAQNFLIFLFLNP